MATLKIEVSTDEQVCCQCGKRGKGYYKTVGGESYICPRCLKRKVSTKISNSSAIKR